MQALLTICKQHAFWNKQEIELKRGKKPPCVLRYTTAKRKW